MGKKEYHIQITGWDGIGNFRNIPNVIEQADYNIVVHNGMPMFNAGNHLCNADAWVNCMPDTTSDICRMTASEVLGDAYIELKHLPKFAQWYAVAKFKNSLTPEQQDMFYVVEMYSGMNNNSSMFSLLVPENKKVIIKRDLGSRGEGMAVIDGYLVHKFLKDAYTRSYKRLREIYPDIPMSYAHADSIFDKKPVIVTEYLEDITAEYRVVYGADKVLYTKRTVEETTTGLRKALINSETTVNNKVALTELIDGVSTDDFSSSESSIIHAFIKSRKKMFGSIDFFRRADGRIGIFEFQHEYAFFKIEPEVIANLHIGYLISLVESIRNK